MTLRVCLTPHCLSVCLYLPPCRSILFRLIFFTFSLVFTSLFPVFSHKYALTEFSHVLFSFSLSLFFSFSHTRSIPLQYNIVLSFTSKLSFSYFCLCLSLSLSSSPSLSYSLPISTTSSLSISFPLSLPSSSRSLSLCEKMRLISRFIAVSFFGESLSPLSSIYSIKLIKRNEGAALMKIIEHLFLTPETFYGPGAT